MECLDNRPLRILVMVNLPWDQRLGAVRIYMELAEQWRAAGHVVEKYSLSDAFQNLHTSSARLTLRQLVFVYKAAGFVRKNSARFDVVDALIGVLPFPKKDLKFHRLVVARSVGLYRLYEQFDRSVEKRWPGRPKGKLLGRIFYGLSRRRLFRASDKAVQHADLINVPNTEEAACLRNEIGEDRAIVVQPYGLTVDRRESLLKAAMTPLSRLQQQRVCFIGMWGPRKGARDWAAIVNQIRSVVPKAQFRFLGTMVDAKAIIPDLQINSTDGIEFVSDYQPDELPRLLADCTVGAFPSYAEGFGLAVLEQLAAGIPTVAYDIAGPRDILAGRLPELLIAKGDTTAFATAICQILRSDPNDFEKLGMRGVEVTSDFSWPKIAGATLSTYRSALGGHSTGPMIFVQPFSLGSAGGGPRILRALLEFAPFQWQSICTSPHKPKPWPNEIHLPGRPQWGRIEHSRFAPIANLTGSIFAPVFRKSLRKRCLQSNARALHVVPHSGLDFAQVHAVAKELALPLFVSLHDDLAYTAARNGTSERKREAAMSRAWREASARFVISEALGREYCSRYGAADYHIVTDGLDELIQPRKETDLNQLRIYFMGLFHMGYEKNLRVLLKGLSILERDHPSLAIHITCRCEHIRPHVLAGAKNVTVLPFASEQQIKTDLETADLLYMPMPFGAAHEKFGRFSLSTKMVTYAGSGVPILYHGPVTSAAFDLLNQNNAAIFVTSLLPQEIARTLAELTLQKRQEVASNALALAERDFMLDNQTQRFWGTVSTVLSAG